MLSVEDALARIFDLLTPLGGEYVALDAALGRVLIEDGVALGAHPPFAASAMDGFGVLAEDAVGGKRLKIIGEAAAGRRYSGGVKKGEAVRIFTGAPVPSGVGKIIIKEDVVEKDGFIRLCVDLDAPSYIRPQGMDFAAGARLVAPKRLTPGDIALLGAMNHASPFVARRPVVAVVSTGNELVRAGGALGPDQIIASSDLGVKARLEMEGASVKIMPITGDRVADIQATLGKLAKANLIVTLGGVSVGDYDLVREGVKGMGFEESFHGIAMRPGKPLLAGRLKGCPMIGLPGNPVSALVCCEVFLVPAIRALLGLGKKARKIFHGKLAFGVGENGKRAHYMRARIDEDGAIVALERQDSAQISAFQRANALLIRPVGGQALTAGAGGAYLRIGNFDDSLC